MVPKLELDSGIEHEADRSELPSFFVPYVTTKASLHVCILVFSPPCPPQRLEILNNHHCDQEFDFSSYKIFKTPGLR